MAQPVLGDVELQLVQKIETDEEELLAQHSVPALEGDFLQRQKRRATQITLTGVLTGPGASDGLKSLRDKFRAAEPVPFVADISTAVRVDQMLIEEMGVRELGGKPERFEYAFTLREYIPAEVVTTEDPPPDPDPPQPPANDIVDNVGTLVVNVVVEGQPNFDFSNATVSVRGTQADGNPQSRNLTNRENDTWTEEALPASQNEYTIEVVASASDPITGSTKATVKPGETTKAKITLHPGTIIATAFVVHFRFDSAFIEPCMLNVLRQVAQRAKDEKHKDEKLLIVGHTDKAGSPEYNQSLAERRARSAFAFLTFAGDKDGVLKELEALRKKRPAGEQPSIKDSWSTFEYQHMLQDLGFYPGHVDGDHGRLTDDAVRAFRCQKGLPPGVTVDDDVWHALIKDYLLQDNFNVPNSKFFANADEDTNCDNGIVAWMGCGEESPLPEPKPTKSAGWRPYRRVDFLFVKASELPCKIPKPDTFNLPNPDRKDEKWCLGPGESGKHCCFGTRELDKASDKRWGIKNAEEDTITVEGTIINEDGTPFANKNFVLIASDGQMKKSEDSKGKPKPGKTDSNGKFQFEKLPTGFYSLEVREQVLAHLTAPDNEKIKGNAVCKALRSDKDKLNVTIPKAPVLREIKIPVVAHLMTTLHPTTRDIRTCPGSPDPAKRIPQKTERTANDIQTLFKEANKIWQQARTRFEPVEVVEMVYADPQRLECAVNSNEIANLLFKCAYPNVINVFFFGTLEAAGEAGVHIEAKIVDEDGNTIETAEGIAMGDRVLLRLFNNADPIPSTPSQEEAIVILSHELGHYLSLDHVTDPSATERLMLPHVAVGNTKLIEDEVEQARTSDNAASECVPLNLQVTGAAQMGGKLSHHFITGEKAGGVVTIDAEIAGAAVDPAKHQVTMEGGEPGAHDHQRLVKTDTKGKVEITAVYTPVGGGAPAKTKVVIFVVTLALRVEGARRIGDATSTNFLALRDTDPASVVTVIADIDPQPFCVPRDLIVWNGGTEAADPLRRTVPRKDADKTKVKATFAPTGESKSADIFVVRVTLDVDADRDGAVEEDAEGKNSWEFGMAKKGAVILCNNDNDDKTSGDATLDSANDKVDGPSDVSDLAPLIIRKSGPLPPGVELILSVNQKSKVRIFDKRATSGNAIIGPGKDAEEKITKSTTADLEFGMEATQYPNKGFDGLIQLTLTLKEGATELGKDEAKVRVAPWIMPSHLDATQEIYVVNDPGFNTPTSSGSATEELKFISTLESIASTAKVSLKKADGSRYLDGPPPTPPDPWMQDTMEIGYSRMPGKENNVALKAIRSRGLRAFAEDELLGPDYGYVEVLSPTRANTLDSHGNLEVSPPVTVAGKEFKLGRIYFGPRQLTARFNKQMKEFLEAQLIQKPFEIDTSWLAVAHVDEIVSFVPITGGSKDFKMLIADTNEAKSLLSALPAAHGSLKLFAGKSHETTVADVQTELAKTSSGEFGWINNECQDRLDDIAKTMKKELGLTDADIIKIPSLFIENPRSPRRLNSTKPFVCDAFIPGMVNMLVITGTTAANTHLVMAKPFGPKPPGKDDIFEKAVKDKLAPLGYAPTRIHFVDDFESYHVSLGEIHCGTNSKRKPPKTPWWAQTDF